MNDDTLPGQGVRLCRTLQVMLGLSMTSLDKSLD